MAEIKSTLDIIMEKTKALTMTEEERETFQRKDWEGKVRGWVQKHFDGIIEIDTFRSNFDTEQKKYPELRQILKTELLKHITLNGDNSEPFRLLEELLGIKSKIFEDLIRSFKSDLDMQWNIKRETLREELKKRKISGSSVVPNPKTDGAWETHIQQLTSRFREQLQSSLDVQ
ncbi:MAG: hypothetical protein ABFD82_09815 [Syntrophaceae bacterium]